MHFLQVILSNLGRPLRWTPCLAQADFTAPKEGFYPAEKFKANQEVVRQVISEQRKKSSSLKPRSSLTYWVDLVDAFPALVALAAHPVSVEVGADAVEHFTGEAVVLPLLRVELQHALVHQVFPILWGTGGRRWGGWGGGWGDRVRYRTF